MEKVLVYTLVGAAIISAQKLEFALLGAISHLSHLPEAKSDKRFRDLTPEKFLRGNPEDLKVTFGQMKAHFGEKLLISGDELNKLIKDRNLVAHSYWRLTETNIKDACKLTDPETFLVDFINRCEKWGHIFRGLVYSFQKAVAEKDGRQSEVKFNEQQEQDIKAYQAHAALVMQLRANNNNSSGYHA